MNIKTFKFIMSNSAYINSFYKDDEKDGWDVQTEKYLPVSSEDEIDNTINSFLDNCSKNGKSIDDIKINDFSVSHHNNGRGDTIQRTYTILYH